MACLALALQPEQGPDILLQTRAWFPLARAIAASASFRATRKAYALRGEDAAGDDANERLGDDPLAASSGQVVVGSDNKYRVVYRLVNSVYVLGITSADERDIFNNVFDCAATVNRAVAILVSTCRGVDVTAEKLARKYPEVYIRLDAVLAGGPAFRLANAYAVAQADTDSKARGAESWNQVRHISVERLANIEVLSFLILQPCLPDQNFATVFASVLSSSMFELPKETLTAGDEVAAQQALPFQQLGKDASQPATEKSAAESDDPFAASAIVPVSTADLAGTFKRDGAATASDPTALLAGLKVSPIDKDAVESVVVTEEGFEGEYGGLDFDDSDRNFLGEGFGGGAAAFGGGLDASEFGAEAVKEDAFGGGLGGLAGSGLTGAPEAAAGAEAARDKTAALPIADSSTASTRGAPAFDPGLPTLWISEEINADFRGTRLQRVGLQGTVHMSPPPQALANHSSKDIDVSFRLEGAMGIKRAAVRSAVASSLGENAYHARMGPADEPTAILKYQLQPRFSPIPLLLRMPTRRGDSSVCVMIQYVANPYLTGELRDVVFTLTLPADPSTVRMSPRGLFDRATKEVRWQVPQIKAQDGPQRLRLEMTSEAKGVGLAFEEEEEISEGDKTIEEDERRNRLEALRHVKGCVQFSFTGQSLSGITLAPAAEQAVVDFNRGENNYRAGKILCS
eukprot:SM000076S21833  [mRNA]  locus=s76:412134:416737:- [translate_table: standard]